MPQMPQGGKKRSWETANGAHADGVVGVEKKEDEESSVGKSRMCDSKAHDHPILRCCRQEAEKMRRKIKEASPILNLTVPPSVAPGDGRATFAKGAGAG